MQFFDAKVRICFFWVTIVCWLIFVLQDTCANMQFEKFNPFTNDH
jgi:hypothetical protein